MLLMYGIIMLLSTRVTLAAKIFILLTAQINFKLHILCILPRTQKSLASRQVARRQKHILLALPNVVKIDF